MEQVTEVNTNEALLLEIEQLREENIKLKADTKLQLSELKDDIEFHKIGQACLNQGYIEGVDETLDWALARIEDIFGAEA